MPQEEMQVVSVGHVVPDARWGIKAHRHAFHEMILVFDGRMQVEGAGRRVDAGPGDVLLYPAGVTHEECSDPQRPVETYFVAFASRDVSDGEVVKAHDGLGRMRQIVRWLHDERHETSQGARAERACLLRLLLAEFERGKGPEPLPIVALARRYAREHISEPLSLDRLARAVGLSKFHFLRLYRAATGHTPMRDVRAMRAHYARELIVGTHLPLKEIAPKAGLGDEYALSRVFRRQFGGTPGQYRRVQRG
jgi:AraC-like DNA-binding protein/mannose-6-phosphate isomerase-like protein (cupin superfamily)